MQDRLRHLIVNSRLFWGCGPETVARLLDWCLIRRLEPGQTLLHPGKPNGQLFLIVSGKLRVHLGSLDEPPLLVLTEGECAGELSVVDGQGASATVVAQGPCEVLAISKELIWSLIDGAPYVARNLLHILAGRVRSDNEEIVQARRQQRELAYAASVDALTGLHNRRWLDQAFARQIARSCRDGQSLALLMLDVDAFKYFNDRYGHLAGDRALCAVARVLADNVRVGDLIARFGGEEFVALLPNATVEQASLVAERLRAAVEAAEIPADPEQPPGRVTISAGLAILRQDETLERLIAEADLALYRAKAEGRNRVVIFRETHEG